MDPVNHQFVVEPGMVVEEHGGGRQREGSGLVVVEGGFDGSVVCAHGGEEGGGGEVDGHLDEGGLAHEEWVDLHDLVEHVGVWWCGDCCGEGVEPHLQSPEVDDVGTEEVPACVGQSVEWEDQGGRSGAGVDPGAVYVYVPVLGVQGVSWGPQPSQEDTSL